MLTETQKKKLAKDAARQLVLIEAGTWRVEEIKAVLRQIVLLNESEVKPKQRRNLKAERIARFTDKGWRKPII